MIFNHVEPPALKELNTESVDGKRYYVTPEGKKYPSVTTVSGFHTAAEIKKWRQRVGEDKANRITTQAATRGTAVHKLCEDYINNVEDYTKGHMPVNVHAFNCLKPLLDTHINNVVMQEAPLYSDFLEVGGRVDCIAEWDGVLSVIDFKTSRKAKKKDWIKSYFMQESAYCVMFEERTKVPIRQIVTVVYVDDDDPQVFIEDRDNYIWDFVDLRKQFKSFYGA